MLYFFLIFLIAGELKRFEGFAGRQMFSLILERFPNYFVLSKIAFISTNQ